MTEHVFDTYGTSSRDPTQEGPNPWSSITPTNTGGGPTFSSPETGTLDCPRRPSSLTFRELGEVGRTFSRERNLGTELVEGRDFGRESDDTFTRKRPKGCNTSVRHLI